MNKNWLIKKVASDGMLGKSTADLVECFYGGTFSIYLFFYFSSCILWPFLTTIGCYAKWPIILGDSHAILADSVLL